MATRDMLTRTPATLMDNATPSAGSARTGLASHVTCASVACLSFSGHLMCVD
ncbi:hypothetical protein M413DRAFT_449977, partial [Hebeloma cylindrosporum]